MKVAVAVLAWFLGALAPAVAAPDPLPLSIVVHGDGAQATKLPTYDPAAPIAIAVTSGTGRLDALTVVATGPAGESVRVPLSPTGDGAFHGLLALQDPGAWSVRLTSRAGSISTDTTPVTLDVAAPPPSNAPWIGLAVGGGMFVLIGGSGFVLLRRSLRDDSLSLQRAA